MKIRTRSVAAGALSLLALIAFQAEAKRIAGAPPKQMTWKTPLPEVSEAMAILKLELDRTKYEKLIFGGRLEGTEVSRTKPVCKEVGKQGLSSPRYQCSYTVTYR